MGNCNFYLISYLKNIWTITNIICCFSCSINISWSNIIDRYTWLKNVIFCSSSKSFFNLSIVVKKSSSSSYFNTLPAAGYFSVPIMLWALVTGPLQKLSLFKFCDFCFSLCWSPKIIQKKTFITCWDLVSKVNKFWIYTSFKKKPFYISKPRGCSICILFR